MGQKIKDFFKAALIFVSSGFSALVVYFVLGIFIDLLVPSKPTKIPIPSQTLWDAFRKSWQNPFYLNSLLFWVDTILSPIFVLLVGNLLFKKLFKKSVIHYWYIVSIAGLLLILGVFLLPKDAADAMSTFSSLTASSALLFWGILRNGFLRMTSNENRSEPQNQLDQIENNLNESTDQRTPSITDTNMFVNSEISSTKQSDKTIIIAINDLSNVHIAVDGYPSLQELLDAKKAPSEIKSSSNSNLADLRELKSLLDDGIITQDDFDRKKAELLG